jgi:predicted CoA-binding protein
MFLRFVNFILYHLGFRFTPDNHVTPVMRFDRFSHFLEAGWKWIGFSQRTLPPISFGVRTGRYTVRGAVSQDNIPFEVDLVIRFNYDPRDALEVIQSRVIYAPDKAWLDLVEDRASQKLRQLTSQISSDEMCEGRRRIWFEEQITAFVIEKVSAVGITLNPTSVIVGEIRAPVKFKQTMLQVRQHMEIMNVLARSEQNLAMIEQMIKAELISHLDGYRGNLTINSPLASLINPNGGPSNGLYGQNGNPAPNGSNLPNGSSPSAPPAPENELD